MQPLVLFKESGARPPVPWLPACLPLAPAVHPCTLLSCHRLPPAGCRLVAAYARGCVQCCQLTFECCQLAPRPCS